MINPDRLYTLESAQDEARELKSLIDAGLAADYNTAETKLLEQIKSLSGSSEKEITIEKRDISEDIARIFPYDEGVYTQLPGRNNLGRYMAEQGPKNLIDVHDILDSLYKETFNNSHKWLEAAIELVEDDREQRGLINLEWFHNDQAKDITRKTDDLEETSPDETIQKEARRISALREITRQEVGLLHDRFRFNFEKLLKSWTNGRFGSGQTLNHQIFAVYAPESAKNEFNGSPSLEKMRLATEGLFVTSSEKLDYFDTEYPFLMLGDQNPRFREVVKRNLDHYLEPSYVFPDNRNDLSRGKHLTLEELETLVEKDDFSNFWGSEPSKYINDALLCTAMLLRKPVFVKDTPILMFEKGSARVEDIAEAILDIKNKTFTTIR